ncbi:MAG: recombinase [Neobacillus sp.]|nr:recombinase [Neobacillus sp.]
MKNKKFGYIRVSAKDQNVARQVESMLKLGIDERDIFIDKLSGKNFKRDQYQLVKRMLREGDILYIHQLDRFGRNKSQILQEWSEITKSIRADIVVLDMPLLDTRKYKDSLGSFIADLVLQILAWEAETEREKIRKNQREGIDVALKNGVRFGRPEARITDDFKASYEKWKNKEITAVEAMRESKIKKTTFYKLVKEMKEIPKEKAGQ